MLRLFSIIFLIPCLIGIIYHYLSITIPDFNYQVCHDNSPLNLLPFFSSTLCPIEQETLLVLKPDGVIHRPMVMQQLKQDHGFRIVKTKTTNMTPQMVDQWYHELRSKDFYPELQRYLTRGPCYAVILKRINAIGHLRYLVGPTDPAKARIEAPWSIRSQIGSSIQENGIHASDSIEAFYREKAILFDDNDK